MKDETLNKIQLLRLDPEVIGDEAARKRKIQFLNFIMNLHSKAAIRRWKEQVFGLKGGDPRYKVLL